MWLRLRVWHYSESCTNLTLLVTFVCTYAGGAAKYWGLARSSGQGAEAGTPKVAAQPQLIPAALFLGTSVTTVSAGWSHTAFVTGSMQTGNHCKIHYGVH